MNNITVICDVEHDIMPGVCAFCERDAERKARKDAQSSLATLSAQYRDTQNLLSAGHRALERAEEERDTALRGYEKFELIEQRAEAAEAKYKELLYAVGSKWPNETRHQTALRYIRERENRGHSDGNTAMQAARAFIEKETR